MLRKEIDPDWQKGESVDFDRFEKAKDTEIDIVFDYFKNNCTKHRETIEQRRILRTWIPNLLRAYELGVILECYIGNQIKANRTVRDKLVECNLIHFCGGSNFKDTGDAYTAKMMTLPLFNDLFTSLIRITRVDEKGKETKSRYEDPVMMDRIFAYNQFMQNHQVTTEDGERLKTDLHRCYKEIGGKIYKNRFHQYSYQSLSDKKRGHLKIDGENVVRFDIKGSHAQIMYHLDDIEMKHDPYNAFPEHLEMRSACKCAMMMILNCSSRKSATAAFNQELRDNPVRFLASAHCMTENGIKIKEVFDKVEALNPKIKHHFYQSACRNAVDIEASILFKTMELLSKVGVPSIQVFDELIISASNEAKAKRALEWAWDKRLGHMPWIEIEKLETKASSSAVSYLKIYAA